MGRFDVDYPHVRSNADIVAVFAGYNVALRGDGEQRKGCCPFHDDDRTSLSVNVRKRLFNCHACGTGGNIIKLVQLLDPELQNPRKAALKAAELSGIGAKPTREEAPVRGSVPSAPELKVVAESSQTPECEVVTEREAGDGLRANRPLTFTLQLAPVDPAGDSPATEFMVERNIPFDRLAELGIGIGQRGSMKDRLAIPIYTKDSELVAYCGRDVGLVDDANEPKYKFPPKFQRELELYGWDTAQQFERVVLVESFLSVIKLGGVLAEFGENSVGIAATMDAGISEAQIALLRETCPEVIVCLDGDEAGMAAAPHVAGHLASAGLWVIDRGAPDWEPHHDDPMQFYKRCCEI